MFMLWFNRNCVLNRQYYDATNSITCRDLASLHRHQMILLDDIEAMECKHVASRYVRSRDPTQSRTRDLPSPTPNPLRHRATSNIRD